MIMCSHPSLWTAMIARTAECLGVSEVHLIYNPTNVVATRGFGGMSSDARKAWLTRLSKSATDWLVIEEHSDIAACAKVLRERGTELLVATTPLTDGAIPLFGHQPAAGGDGAGGAGAAGGDGADGSWARRPLALLFGSEN